MWWWQWQWDCFFDWAAPMTQDPLPDGYVVHLPAPKARPEHKFGAALRLAPDPARKRHEQTERVCASCKLVKVTVHHHDGRAWREWRLPGTDRQFEDERTPVCAAVAP